MAVAIRLARQGAKKRPFYRVVAADKTAPRDGRFIDQLGFYDPRAKQFQIDQERYDSWIANGALPTDTVKQLVKKNRRAASAE